ncbi:MAG: hypothetical protein ACLFV6_12275 [Spirulinaceae cyanobacterium]
MKPKFKTVRAWDQAQVLMQPIFIRLVDNIRKKLEDSTWKGTYTEKQHPVPGYELTLTRSQESYTFNLWEMCYRICFRNYQITHADNTPVEVEIDTHLFDPETGEVDWNQIEDKTKAVVDEIFSTLPSL